MPDADDRSRGATPAEETMSTTNSTVFTCSICDEPSTQICCWCTKDACENHLCEKCSRCSDCCVCERERMKTV